MNKPIPSLPMDTDAERAVLGSILIDPDRLRELDLRPAAFGLERHADIFRAMQTVAASGAALDYVTLTSYLEAHRLLASVGDSSYIAGLIRGIPTAFHVHAYAAIVKERAARRAVIALAGQMAHDAYNPASDLDAARAAWLTELVSTINTQGGAEPVAITAGKLAAELEAAAEHPQEIFGLATGFADFDAITKGLQSGEVVLLSGQPGMGKSLFAGQTFFQMGAGGIAGAYYGLEMQAIATLRRQLAGLSFITTARMRGGFVREDEWQGLYAHIGKLASLPLFISDATHWNTLTLRADIARLKAKADIQFVIVDHIGLLKDRASDPNERDKQVSLALHDLAKDLSIAVLGIHTMNKEGIRNGGIPSLADVSGSAKFSYDADVICFLTEHLPQRGEAKEKKVRTISFGKFREDDADRYMHLIKAQVRDERNRMHDLPLLLPYQED